MNDQPIILPLSNPVPDVDLAVARELGAAVATGSSSDPNQVNALLAFPGIWRGILDARATALSEEMKLAAAEAIDQIAQEEAPARLVPSPFNTALVPAVAAAVAVAARTSDQSVEAATAS